MTWVNPAGPLAGERQTCHPERAWVLSLFSLYGGGGEEIEKKEERKGEGKEAEAASLEE